MNSVKIAEELGTAVWKARNPDAIDRLVVDDFVITTGGVDIVTKDRCIPQRDYEIFVAGPGSVPATGLRWRASQKDVSSWHFSAQANIVVKGFDVVPKYCYQPVNAAPWD
jgi:hypothetical protein